MPNARSELCNQLLADLDAGLSSAGAAKLTDKQYEDVRGLRDVIRALCRKGKEEEARATVKRALEIIKEGPPSR